MRICKYIFSYSKMFAYIFHFSIIPLILSSISISFILFESQDASDCHINQKSPSKNGGGFFSLLDFFLFKFFCRFWSWYSLRHEEKIDNTICHNPIDKHSKECCPLEIISLIFRQSEDFYKRCYKGFRYSIDKTCESSTSVCIQYF